MYLIVKKRKMKSKSKVKRRPDNEIYEELQNLTVQREARDENALNYLITNDQERDFFRRLKNQERPSGVQ